MAAYPTNYQRKKTIYWNDGSTARVLHTDDLQLPEYNSSAAPKQKPEEPPVIPQRQPKAPEVSEPKKQEMPKHYAKPRVEHNIGFFSMCFLVAAIVVTLYTCFLVLNVRSETVAITKEVRQLEDRLASLREGNEAARNEVFDAINLDEVYRVAVQELNMVYPNKNKTLYYQGSTDGYVRQFGDIPKADKFAFLEEIMRQVR